MLPYFVETNYHFVPLLSINFDTIIFDYIFRQKLEGIDLASNYLKQLPSLKSDIFSYESILNYLVPLAIEFICTAWDIKPFAGDVWNDADERLRDGIRRQWEENQREIGGHGDAKVPEGLDIIYYLSPQSKSITKIPFLPFKWDEERRARLKPGRI